VSTAQARPGGGHGTMQHIGPGRPMAWRWLVGWVLTIVEVSAAALLVADLLVVGVSVLGPPGRWRAAKTRA
jgi:hypothetical protein